MEIKDKDNDRAVNVTNIAIINEGSILLNGQYRHQPSKHHKKIDLNDVQITIEGTNKSLKCKIYCRLDRCEMSSDFTIEIFNTKKEDIIGKRLICVIYHKSEKLTLKYDKITEPIIFPFEDIQKDGYNKDESVFIATFSVSTNNRIEEWIQYNLKLGFDGIVILHHDPWNIDKEMYKITDKYKNVYVIHFPYRCCGGHWRNVQRMGLTVGLSGLRKFTKWVSLIDVDEFIFIHKHKKNDIKLFLEEYSDFEKDIKIQSRLITNKENDKNFKDIDYNFLNYARYVGGKKYTKMIFNCKNYKGVFFIATPHDSRRHKMLPIDEIIHYHLWANARYKYTPELEKFDGLYNFLYN